MKRCWRLSVKKRPNAVAHQSGGETNSARMGGQVCLLAAMIFQPGQVIGQLSRQCAYGERVHHTFFVKSFTFAACGFAMIELYPYPSNRETSTSTPCPCHWWTTTRKHSHDH